MTAKEAERMRGIAIANFRQATDELRQTKVPSRATTAHGDINAATALIRDAIRFLTAEKRDGNR